MDAIIGKLSIHPDANKGVSNLLELCTLAKGLRERDDMPGFEKRKRCLTLFEAAVGSGKPKLAHIGIEGFQLLLRDSVFNSDSDSSKDEQRTAVQTLSHLSALPTWDKTIQCQAVTVIVQLISNTEVKLLLSDLYAAIQLCANTYKTSDDQSVKLAVRAALTQLLNSFCINRYSNVAPESQDEIVVFMDMTALIKELLTRIDSGQQSSADELQLGLDALYSTVSVQPPHFYKHQPLLNVFT
uniref:Uncharacterized protein n=1 Tax=Panagrolaimus davidi TaxID=227884 RepID=A0A914PHD0_9BILA